MESPQSREVRVRIPTMHLLRPLRAETTKKRNCMNYDTHHYYTAYVVRSWNAKFLNQRTYTGRTPNMWGKIGESFVFRSVKRAQACASSINKRPKDRVNADPQNATVETILLPRRNPRRA
jgi:hypothetical protein